MAIDPNILPTPLEYATPQQQALADALARRRGGGLDPQLVARALMEGRTEQPEDSLRKRTEAVTKMLEPGPQPDAAAAAPVQTAQAAGLPNEPVVPGGPAMAPDTRRALGILQGGQGGGGSQQPLIGFIARMTGLGVPMHEIMEFVRQRQALMPQYGVSPEGLVTRQQPGRMPQVMGPLPGHPGKPGEMELTGTGKIPTRTFYGPDGRLHTEYVMPGGSGGSGGGGEGGGGGTYGTARTIEDFQELGAKAKARQEGLVETEKELAKGKAVPIVESIKKGDVASKAVQFLNTMDEIGKLPDSANMNSGPHAHTFLKAKQLMVDLFPEMSKRLGIEGVPTAEAIEKLNGFLAQQAAKELTSRPTQFDFKTFLERNPGIEVSKEGRQFLIDMLRQSYKQDLEVAKAAQKIRDPSDWFDVQDKIQEKHPIRAVFRGQPITSATQYVPEFNVPATAAKEEYSIGHKVWGVPTGSPPGTPPVLLELRPDGWYAGGKKIQVNQPAAP